MMIMEKPSLPLIALGLVLCTGLPAPVHALECPLPQHARDGSVLLSPDETKALGQRLITDDTGNAVPEAAAELRAKNPTISAAKIVDTLTGAYCTAIATKGLEESAAKAKVKTFSRQALDQLKE